MEELIKQKKVYYCVECGKCTSICPSSKAGEYTPESFVEKSLLGLSDEAMRDRRIWSCLTCMLCKERCTYGVDFPGFVRGVREKAGRVGLQAHGGSLFSIMDFQTRKDMNQKRLAWAEGLQFSRKGKVVYFVGCSPYLDIIFQKINANTLEISRSAVKILNSLGINPVLLEDERCCGHDLYWMGETEKFEKLAKLNVRMIEKSGAEKVVFTCAEGYSIFKLHYPEYVKTSFETVHISEMLSGVELKKSEKKMTYHDPCRLGRHLGIYDAPRKVIEGLGELVEMRSTRENSTCCGTSAWTNCDGFSEKIRRERLEEALATGAGTLVTTCPKCLIHFKCTLSNMDTKIEVEDLAVLAARGMKI